MSKKIFVVFIFLAVLLLGNSKQANADLGICSSYEFWAKFVDSNGNDITSDPVVYNYNDPIYVSFHFLNTGHCSSTLIFDGVNWSGSSFDRTAYLVSNSAGNTSSWWRGNTTATGFAVKMTGTTLEQGVYDDYPLLYDVNNYPDLTLDFSATKNTINIGERAELNYTISGSNECVESSSPYTAGHWTDEVGYSINEPSFEDGSHTYFATPSTIGTKTYGLDCYNSKGEVIKKTVNVNVVNPPPAPTLNFYADPPSPIAYNTATNLIWSTTNTTSCWASGDWVNDWRNNFGGTESTWNLTTSKTYNLECWNDVGDTTGIKTVNVAVNPPNIPSSPTTLTAPCDATGKITASWSAVSGTGITYALRIDTNPTPPHLLAVDGLTTTSYPAWQGVPGTTYNVWVHAIKDGTYWSNPPKLISTACVASPPPPPPPVYNCADSIPSGSTACSGDDANLLVADSWHEVGTTSSDCTDVDKCEYYTPDTSTPTPRCTGVRPAGTRPWAGDNVQSIPWVYSETNTPRNCEYRCQDGYVRVNDVCVAGPNVTFYISDPMDPRYIDTPERNDQINNFILGSSATFAYRVSGTSTYPATYCEASASDIGAGDWSGSQSFIDGELMTHPGIAPINATPRTKNYDLTCYNSVGAYTTKRVKINVEPVNVTTPPTAEITKPIPAENPIAVNEILEFQGKGIDPDGIISSAPGNWTFEWLSNYDDCVNGVGTILGTKDKLDFKSTTDGVYNIYLRVASTAYPTVKSTNCPSKKVIVGNPYECVDISCPLLENCGKTMPLTCIDKSSGIPANPQSLCVPACGNTKCPNCVNPASNEGWKEVAP